MTAETMPGENTPLADVVDFGPGSDRAAGWFLRSSVGFFGLGILLLCAAAIQLVAPGFLGGVAYLSYGRLYPMATHALLYGWLTLGFLGLGVFLLPRAAGRPLGNAPMVIRGLGVLTVGYLAGLVGIGAGMSEGRRYVEAPLWADVLVLVGLVVVVTELTRTIRDGDATGPAQWFLVAGSWWLVLSHVVGNLPGVGGTNSTIQSAFYEASIFGLWFAAAGIGVAYYVVPRITGHERSRPTQLAVLGFWSLAFVWAATGPRSLVYGTAPDWLETVGAIFSIGLAVPVVVVFTDLVGAARHRWSEINEKVTIRFVMAGVALLAVLALQNLVMSLRAASAVTQFTQWITAYEDLAVLGAFSLILFGGIYHAIPMVLGHGVERRLAGWHFGLTASGLGLMLGSMWIGGLQLGNTWAAGANEDAFASTGDAFVNSVAPFDGHYVIRLVGLLLVAAGAGLFMANVATRGGSVAGPVEPADDDDVSDELAATDTIDPGRLRLGAVGLFGLAALLVFVLPSLERDHGEGTLLGDSARLYQDGSMEAQGREIYLREGCWYCHTQEVRPIVTDVGLGAVSEPGDYVHEVPALRGVQRIGPDLMHAGSRAPTDSVRWVVEFLEEPAETHAWTKQPSYDHLSNSELQALATYIAGLE